MSSSSGGETSVDAADLAVEAAVIGGGPAGLTAAIALAAAGVETALIARLGSPVIGPLRSFRLGRGA